MWAALARLALPMLESGGAAAAEGAVASRGAAAAEGGMGRNLSRMFQGGGGNSQPKQPSQPAGEGYGPWIKNG